MEDPHEEEDPDEDLRVQRQSHRLGFEEPSKDLCRGAPSGLKSGFLRASSGPQGERGTSPRAGVPLGEVSSAVTSALPHAGEPVGTGRADPSLPEPVRFHGVRKAGGALTNVLGLGDFLSGLYLGCC